MNIIQQTEQLLTDTERSLVKLANEAGAARDYDQAASLIELARKVKQLSDEFASSAASPAATTAELHDEAKHSLSSIGTENSARSRNKLGQYPKFVREGDSLIKIGWSKSEKAEYEHKSPKRLLTALCQVLTNARGKRITMDKVLPLKDPLNGSGFSDYQAYVCLAWLKSAGLVIQHGRQGYSLPKGTDLVKTVETQWANLPSR
jgi:hypothetical protein